MTYVELHCHSAYSLLDGASLPEELAVRAAELGYPALALTDHNGLYGSLEFAHAAKAIGVRAITGAEVTLTNGSHLTLLVETPRGYSNLCQLLTKAHSVERLEPRLDPALLLEGADGLICLSGCARQGLATSDPNAAAELGQIFGLDRFYVELQRPYSRGDVRRNAALRGLAEALGARTVVTGNVHAHAPGRVRLQDVLVAIGNRSTLEACELERRGNEEFVLLPPHEVASRFPEDAEAVVMTAELAERLTFDLTQELGYRYPDFSDTEEPASVSSSVFAVRPSRSGTATPPGGSRDEADARLRKEIELIDHLELSGFFLLHWEVPRPRPGGRR